MTLVFNASFSPTFVEKQRHPSKLKIAKKQNPGPNAPKYEYSFSTQEFVVTDIHNPGVIELVLDMAQLPNGIDNMYIHEFCCTRGDSMKPVAYKNALGQPLTGFGQNTVYVALKPELFVRELVSVGLLVAILEHGAASPELILCDPQVGNGPPVQSGTDLLYPAVPLS
jgi:hypothetical protein